MLGILFIYWVGKSFYTLAEKNKRNNWLWAVLGVVSFYAAQIIFGVLFYVIMYWDGGEEDMDETLINIAGVLIGGLVCWGLYEFLKKHWAKTAVNSIIDSNVLDEDLIS